MLAQANHDYQKKFRRPTTERKVFPQLLQFSTTKDAMHVVSLEAGADQLAAPSEPPVLARPDADVSLPRSTSRASTTWRPACSRAWCCTKPRCKRPSASCWATCPSGSARPHQEPWTIVFARQQPISVSFGDGGFNITLRGQEYFKGDKGYPGMNVSATYKFVKQGDVFKAIRQGDLQIFPPGFVPGHGQIGVRHQVVRQLLERRVRQDVAARVGGQGHHAHRQAGAAIGKLYPVEMDAQNGWLVVAWQREAVEAVGGRGQGKARRLRRRDAVVRVPFCRCRAIAILSGWKRSPRRDSTGSASRRIGRACCWPWRASCSWPSVSAGSPSTGTRATRRW